MKITKGFTLIELLVVLAIIAMLAAYAIPNYRQYVVRSKRADAQSTVLEIAGMYEKFYANTNAYPVGLTGGGTSLSLNSTFLTLDDYTIATGTPVAPATWRIEATATGAQLTDDTVCPTIWLNNLGGRGPSDACWTR